MQCNAIKYDLPDYVTCSLPKNKMDAIAIHLRTCRDCNELVQSFHFTFQKINASAVAKPNDLYWTNFRVHVDQKIRKKNSPWYTLFWIHKIALPAVVTAIMVFVMIKFIPNQPADHFSTIKESEILSILVQSNTSDFKTVEQTYDQSLTFHSNTEFLNADAQTTDLAVKDLEKTLIDESSRNDLLASSAEYLSDSDILNNLSDSEASEIVEHLDKKIPF